MPAWVSALIVSLLKWIFSGETIQKTERHAGVSDLDRSALAGVDDIYIPPEL